MSCKDKFGYVVFVTYNRLQISKVRSMQKIPLAGTQKQYISHNCSGMKLTVLYLQWLMWKDFSKLFQKFFKTFSKYLTIHSTSLSCFDGSIVLLFSLYFLLLIIFVFCNVWENVWVRFTYNVSVDYPFCNFLSIAATVAGLQDLEKNTSVRVNSLCFRVEAMKIAYFPHVRWPYILLNNMVQMFSAINLEYVWYRLIATGFLFILFYVLLTT